jgi:hypothetical protein
MQRRLTIISTALPKVVLINPPKVSLGVFNSSSVEYNSNAASGKMAKKLEIKTTAEFQPKAPVVILNGTKTKRIFA